VPIILGGRTGTGKTLLLHQLDNSIDLEGIANHRGSAFGSFITPQPSQIDFENRLAVALIKHRHQGFKHIVLEDEGNYIGARYIPHDLAHFFRRDSMVLLECELSRRLEITFKEYVVDAQQEYVNAFGSEQGLGEWLTFMQNRLHRIRKRLGGERLQRVQLLLDQAYRHQLDHGGLSLHKKWIELLLTEYYDPMYDYQIEKSGRKIAFRGGDAEVLEYLRDLETSSSKSA
jgi:tRNA 2-selenouridine synthase